MIPSYASLMFLWNCRVTNKHPNHQSEAHRGEREAVAHKQVITFSKFAPVLGLKKIETFHAYVPNTEGTRHFTGLWEFRESPFLDQEMLICGSLSELESIMSWIVWFVLSNVILLLYSVCLDIRCQTFSRIRTLLVTES